MGQTRIKYKEGTVVKITKMCTNCTGDMTGAYGVISSVGMYTCFLEIPMQSYIDRFGRPKKTSSKRWQACSDCTELAELDRQSKNAYVIYGVMYWGVR